MEFDPYEAQGDEDEGAARDATDDRSTRISDRQKHELSVSNLAYV